MPSFCGLVWIGSRPDRDLLTPTNFLQVAPQQPGGFFLHEDLVLELGGITDLHELVGVARIAVLTGKLAAAVGIDGPGEGKIAAGLASVEDRPDRQRKELDLMSAIHVLGLAGKLGDADQVRGGIDWI